ncbi:hypothetical protein [Larkinella sp.]|uniref:hypothetical protein n=1 Tax=Larkinella sp. TaxID=2034517 RepID=UPI003BAA4DEA
MNELTKYESIQELKAHAKPADPTSARSKERHDRFERFINSLKDSTAKDVSPSQNNVPTNEGDAYGL